MSCAKEFAASRDSNSISAKSAPAIPKQFTAFQGMNEEWHCGGGTWPCALYFEEQLGVSHATRRGGEVRASFNFVAPGDGAAPRRPRSLLLALTVGPPRKRQFGRRGRAAHFAPREALQPPDRPPNVHRVLSSSLVSSLFPSPFPPSSLASVLHSVFRMPWANSELNALDDRGRERGRSGEEQAHTWKWKGREFPRDFTVQPGLASICAWGNGMLGSAGQGQARTVLYH